MMKKILAILLVMLTCPALPVQAAELASPGTPAVSSESRYLLDNYQFVFTLERPKKEPLVLSYLNGGRMAELSHNSNFDPLLTIVLKPTFKENDRFLVDFSIGFRVKIEGDKFLDEGIKGSVYLLLGKEVTILQEPGRTIKLKVALPNAF
jgi:hypothetical protein